MPRRGDLDPIEIPLLLPNIMLVDVEEPRRFRYRLIGTDCTQSHGFDATGRYLDEVLRDMAYRTFVIALYEECVAKRRPIYSETLFAGTDRRRRAACARRLHALIRGRRAREHGVRGAACELSRSHDARDRHFLEASPFKEVAHHVL